MQISTNYFPSGSCVVLVILTSKFCWAPCSLTSCTEPPPSINFVASVFTARTARCRAGMLVFIPCSDPNCPCTPPHGLELITTALQKLAVRLPFSITSATIPGAVEFCVRSWLFVCPSESHTPALSVD